MKGYRRMKRLARAERLHKYLFNRKPLIRTEGFFSDNTRFYQSPEEAFASLKKIDVIEPDGLKANAYCGAYDIWKERLEKLI